MATALHNLKRTLSKKRSKRVGRGNASGKGTYSSRGIKGQRSRAGGKGGLKRRSLMRQLVKKTPKLGGFTSGKNMHTINLDTLDRYFNNGETVSVGALRKRKLISRKHTGVKIVARGKLSKKLTITGIPLTKAAQKQITK